MTTAYPSGIDNFTNPTSTDTLSSSTVPHASEHANANDAIKAIETELGTNPKGSYASVSARLAASTGSITTWRKAAAGGETSLSGTDDFSTTLAYTVGQEQVFINGVLLERGVDYTATTGSSITGLTALVASDIATVISVGSFNVANAIPLSTVTTKGDLIAATGASTVANVGVGADGTTLVANSASATGVAWATQQIAGKNCLINGGFDIWQRGISSAGNAYLADRWYSALISGTGTFAQEATTVPTGVSYAMKFTASATAQPALYQAIETLNSLQFAGQNVTVSSQVAASASTGFTMDIQYSTSVDNSVTGTWTSITATSGGTATATSTTYVPISGVYAIPSTVKSLRVRIFTTSTIANTVVVYFGKAQTELGTIATFFTRNAPTLQGELAACQRYYYQPTAGVYWNGYATSGVNFYVMVYLPVAMRTSPTITNTSIAAGNFPATASSPAFAGTTSFANTRTANNTGAGGFADTYTASAEL